MKNLTATICLTIAVLLGSSGVSWSADAQKGVDAYENGDYLAAVHEWKPLAENGDAVFQGMLGSIYCRGKPGINKDHKKALKWFTLAAEQGNANAQTNLGVMYDKGQGIIQDNVYAHMWWNIAASSGESKNASNNRDIVAGRMTPAQIADAQKLARECVRKKYKGC